MELIDLDGHGEQSEMYAYIAIDKNGKSGICAGFTGLGASPFVGMTREDVKRWKPMVEEIRRETDKEIKLVRYTAAEIIED